MLSLNPFYCHYKFDFNIAAASFTPYKQLKTSQPKLILLNFIAYFLAATQLLIPLLILGDFYIIVGQIFPMAQCVTN
jgi:hypothetical protein